MLETPSKPPSAYRHLVSCFALLALAITFWHWRILGPAIATGPIGSLCSDLYTSYIPVLARAAEEIRSGNLPLWNPDQLAGVPVVPSWFQFGAFYPLNALLLFLPTHTALGWTACLHLAIAGGGMLWLATAIGLSGAAGRFAAVTYMLSQPLAVLPNLFTASTLAPAVLASWVALVQTPKRRTVATAAALLALQLSTGGNQIVVYTLYASGLLLPFIFATRPTLRTVAALGLAAALAVGLVAVLLLPTTVSVDLSSRATGRLSLADTLPFPAATLRDLARQLLDQTPGLPRIFYGWAALALALLGIAWPQRRSAWPGVVLITLTGTLLVLGPNTPAYELYYGLPTGSWFRSPERAAMLMAIGVALLAAYGVERLQQGQWHRVASWLVLLPIVELFRATYSWLPYPQARPLSAFAPPAASSAIRSTLGSQRAYVGMNWQDRFPFMEKLGTWQRLAVANDYDTLTPAVYGDYFRALLGPQALVDPIFAGRYHPMFAGITARRAMDMLAVKLLLIAPGAPVQWVGAPGSAPPGSEPMLLENRTALPRAYVVHRVKSVENEDAALRLLADLRFDPASTAVVIGGGEIDQTAAGGSPGVALLSFEPDRVTLEAELDRPGLLVLTDLMFPGWEARVDSAPAPIFRTNLLFRGLYLGSGKHVVEFEYHAPRLALGAWVSAASFLVLLVLVVPRSALGLVHQFGLHWRRNELTPCPPLLELLEREGEPENEMISFKPPSLSKRRGFGG